jgi:hypothetical protein
MQHLRDAGWMVEWLEFSPLHVIEIGSGAHPASCSVCIRNKVAGLEGTWTSLYETLCVCHGSWAHLNGVLYKSLTSACVSVCLSLHSLWGNGSVHLSLLSLWGNGSVHLSLLSLWGNGSVHLSLLSLWSNGSVQCIPPFIVKQWIGLL